MADVRCHMCGKSNPADADICRHCQARLKPLGPPSLKKNAAPGATPAQPPAEEGDATDWLRGLIDPTGAAASEESAPTEATPAESADWLARIGAEPAPAAPEPTPEEPWLNQFAPPTEEAPAAGSDDLSSWLASLRDDDEAQAAAPTPAPTLPASGWPEPPPTPAEEPVIDLPDWLKELDSPEAETPPAQPPVESSPAWPTSFTGPAAESPEALPADVPDWLRKNKPAAKPTPPPAAQDDDWLSSFQAASPAADTDAPDWLRKNKPAAEPTPPPAAQDDDWLNSFQAASPAAAPGGPGVPDWLSEFTAPAEEPAQPGPAPTPDSDWLADFRGPAADEPAPAAANAPKDVPDWLRDFQDIPAAQAAGLPPTPPAEPPAAANAPEDVPDWLRDFQSSPTIPIGQAPPAEPPMAANAPEDVPDWLREFQGGPAAPAAAEAPAEPPMAANAPEDVPDWLRNFQGSPAAPAAAEPLNELPAAAQTPDENPDWLRNFQDSPAAATAAPADAAQAGPSALPDSEQDTPDWLKDFYGATTAAVPAAAAPDADSAWMRDFDRNENAPPVAQDRNQTRPLTGLEAEEALPGADLPDWLASAQPPAESTAQAGQNLPDWLKKAPVSESSRGGVLPFSHQEPIVDDAAPPFASSEMNELLAGVSADAAAASEPGATGEAGVLEPVQLPNWLQAMRPVESGVSGIPTSEADDIRVEKSGPLAGLRGVLPGEDLVAKYRKPPIYTNKLQVSEKQQVHASLLENLVNGETQSQPLPGESIRASQFITRLLVAVLLIALILLPALTTFRLAVPGGLRGAQPDAEAVSQSISSMTTNGYVLVVADFEAGLTGELKTISQPVLRDLQKHQPRVVLASTLPVGSVLGELLLQNAQVTPVANLGYLAGGAQVLKRLAAPASMDQPDPLAQVVPFLYVGGASFAWNDLPALRGIHDINSFQRIVLLTDSVETARAWVEQVQPSLAPETHLLVVSSAQAAPLVRTYVESGQVQGLVGGVPGGAAYELITRQPGQSGTAWTAYQLCMLAVILLIVAGAVAAGLSNLFRRNQKRKA